MIVGVTCAEVQFKRLMKAGVTNRIRVFLCSVGIFGIFAVCGIWWWIQRSRSSQVETVLQAFQKRWIAGQQCFCMCMSPYEPLCTTRLNWININIINRRTLSFSRCAFSAVHCCTVLCPFSPLPRPDHKDDPPARNTPWFLTCNGESLQSSWLHCWFLCAVN